MVSGYINKVKMETAMSRMTITDKCTCDTCRQYMTAEPSNVPFINEFRDMIRNGTVRHVETVNGKALYRRF
jgi:hypothetical protein